MAGIIPPPVVGTEGPFATVISNPAIWQGRLWNHDRRSGAAAA